VAVLSDIRQRMTHTAWKNFGTPWQAKSLDQSVVHALRQPVRRNQVMARDLHFDSSKWFSIEFDRGKDKRPM